MPLAALHKVKLPPSKASGGGAFGLREARIRRGRACRVTPDPRPVPLGHHGRQGVAELDELMMSELARNRCPAP